MSAFRGGLSKSNKRKAIHDLCMQQGWRCFWCGQIMSKDLESDLYRTLDHVVALSIGGKVAEDRSNIVAACKWCNTTRGNYQNLVVKEKRLNEVEHKYELANKLIEKQANELSNCCKKSDMCVICRLKPNIINILNKLKRKLLNKEIER